jgi:DNA-binding response OmpR family regulator
MRLLLVEDEAEIAEPLTKGLKNRGFALDWADNGKKGYSLAYENQYDCIILDLNLPDMDGLEIANKLRAEQVFTPILILTARSTQDNILEGFKSGTDDYMVKPFNFSELVYRINSLIKRNSYNKEDLIELGDIIIDLKALSVTKSGALIQLNNKEFGILEYLARNKGKVVSQEELLEHVWDQEIDLFSQTVRTNIKTLRKKIDGEKKLIKNIKGKGYVIER